MTVLNTTSPEATATPAPISSPSKTVPSASTSSPSRSALVSFDAACMFIQSNAYSFVSGPPVLPEIARVGRARRDADGQFREWAGRWRWSSEGGSVADDELALEDRVADPAAQRGADERGVPAL